MGIQSKVTGFTLIELLVTIVILAITVTFAIPSFQNLMANSQLQEGRDRLRTAVQFSKGEAIAGNQTVSLCPSADGSTCGDSNDWDENWLVVTDSNETGAVAIVNTLRVFEAPDSSEVTVVHTGGFDWIRFETDGISIGLNATASFGFCDPDGEVDPNSLILLPSTAAVRTGTVAEANCP